MSKNYVFPTRHIYIFCTDLRNFWKEDQTDNSGEIRPAVSVEFRPQFATPCILSTYFHL